MLTVFSKFRAKHVSQILSAGRTKIRTCKIEGNGESLQFSLNHQISLKKKSSAKKTKAKQGTDNRRCWVVTE